MPTGIYKRTEQHRERISGPGNPNWQGGKSRCYKDGYDSSQYTQWRRDVFIRDEFTCRRCNTKHIYITAHHIKSFIHFPELRFKVSNGKTLCEDCHRLTDNYKGKSTRGYIPWNKGKRGFKVSDKARQNMSLAKQGCVPWNKGIKTGIIPSNSFRKGHIPWNKRSPLCQKIKL